MHRQPLNDNAFLIVFDKILKVRNCRFDAILLTSLPISHSKGAAFGSSITAAITIVFINTV